jgi:hypothetical protein
MLPVDRTVMGVYRGESDHRYSAGWYIPSLPVDGDVVGSGRIHGGFDRENT